jgi:transketolase
MLSAKLGPGNPLDDAFVYAICSDGDLMEGISAEAASFAGHQRLGRLVYLYDDNRISIDGKTDITFSEDVTGRLEAAGWHVQSVDGRDHEGISRAIEAAKRDPRPSLIRVRTTIGYGAPRKAGTPGVHGAPLGEEELAATKKNLGWPLEPRFLVPDEVRAFWEEVRAEKRAQRESWDRKVAAWRSAHPDRASLLDAHVERTVPADLGQRLIDGSDAVDSTPLSRRSSRRRRRSCRRWWAVPPTPESNLTGIKGRIDRPGTIRRNILRIAAAIGAIANGLA